MTDTIRIGISQLTESGPNIYSIGDIDPSDGIQKIFLEVMRRSSAKYVPFLQAKAKELGADPHIVRTIHNRYLGCIVEYGIGLYKEDEILGYVPFEIDFLGQRGYAGNTGWNPIKKFFEKISIAAEPRFIEAKGRDSYFHQGPLLRFQIKQPSVDLSNQCPDKIDF